MHLTFRSFMQVFLVIKSFCFVGLALLYRWWKPAPCTSGIVFFSAVPRQTIELLVDRLLHDDEIKLPLSRWVFSTNSKHEIPWDCRNGQVPKISADSFLGALALVDADLIIVADRPRSLWLVARFGSAPVVDVWHGISFKPIIRPRFLRVYSEIWVVSTFLKSAYQSKFGIPPERLICTGWSPVKDPSQAESALAFRRHAANRLKVLIAPTWRKKKFWRLRNQIRMWEGAGFLNELALRTGLDIKLRLHHLDDVNRRNAATGASAIALSSERDAFDPAEALKWADLLITDWSALAFHNLALGGATVFMEDDGPLKRYLLPPRIRWGPIVRDRVELDDLLENISLEPRAVFEPYEERRKKALKLIFENTQSATSLNAQVERIKELVSLRRGIAS